jgi:L-ascorbate metabolism protein UlaG (beta-lactamase superfamily)
MRRLLSLICLPLLAAACAATDETPMPNKPAHHLADGRFRNPYNDNPPAPATLGESIPFFWGMLWKGFNTVTVPEGHVLARTEVDAELQRHHNADSYTWLGHAAFLIKLGGATILTDPYLSEVAGPFNAFGPKRYVPSALSPAELPPIDILTLSHNHYDHLDLKAIAAIPHKDRISVVVPLGLGGYFRDSGYTDVTELDWYDRIERKGVSVTLTPAVHFSRRGPFDGNHTLWGGFAYAAGGRRVFFSGDTTYGPVFREIGEKLGPFDAAFVGIGAYEPQAIMRSSHTTPEQAAQLARDIGAKRVIGMHWGTVVLSNEPPFEAPARLRAAATAIGYAPGEADVMPIGATRAF